MEDMIVLTTVESREPIYVSPTLKPLRIVPEEGGTFADVEVKKGTRVIFRNGAIRVAESSEEVHALFKNAVCKGCCEDG